VEFLQYDRNLKEIKKLVDPNIVQSVSYDIGN